jgi:hypothetical protein
MSTQTDAVTTAAADLTHAMSRLVKAIDDLGDDGEAIKHIPQDLPDELGRLASRIGADSGLSGS